MKKKDIIPQSNMFYGASPLIFERAKELRKNETEAEKLLWEKLSNKQLGVRFRRQHPMYRFIADFYCHELPLVIEVDGETHDGQEAQEYDEARTYIINELGIEVIRFINEEIYDEIDQVLKKITDIITQKQQKLKQQKAPFRGFGGKKGFGGKFKGALIGKPLTHSFSQTYFTQKFKREKIDGTYHLIELEDITDFPAMLEANPDLRGINVTIPYKTAVIPYLDSLSPEAEAIGAVNVIRLDGNKRIGYNSDVYGFAISLEHALAGLNCKQAIILGTGGASKGVRYVLETKYGITHLIYVSRTPGPGQVSYSSLHELNPDDFQLVVNTTPLGTYPHVDTVPDFPFEKLDKRHLAFDLVYNPEVSLFLKKARERGAAIQNGLEMLHLQAEKAWEIWTQSHHHAS